MPAIQIAHSIIAGHQPILQLPGQIAINEADSLLYMRDASGNAVPVLMGIPGMLYGGNTANNGGAPTSNIDIAPAVVAADLAPYPTMILSSTLTKNVTVNWVVGNNQGGLDTGSVGNGTYHLFLIRRPDTGVVDALFSLSPTSPTMPANYTQKRRIASIGRVAAANVLYTQNADEFLLKTIPVDIGGTSPPTTSTLYTLSVPTGINVRAIFYIQIDYNTQRDTIAVSAPDQGSFTGSTPFVDNTYAVSSSSTVASDLCQMRTNTSAQIYVVSEHNDGKVYVSTMGWFDTRGRT
jgi:hypothetical protein